MNNERKFKTGLFGYSKKDINDFIVGFNRDIQKALDDKDDKIEDLKKENASLNEKIKELEKERKLIGDAILKAETKATDIIEQAVSESQVKKQKIEDEIKHSIMILRKINEEVRQLKANVIESVNKYQSELDILIKASDEDLKEL